MADQSNIIHEEANESDEDSAAEETGPHIDINQ